MRKLLVLIIILLLMTGCTKKENQITSTEFYPTYNYIDIKLDTFFRNILITIGEYNAVRTSQSSKNEGDANIYEYDNFEIETYYDKNEEKIYLIRITSEEQLTNEGIKIGDTKEQMISIYGKDYINVEDCIFIYNLSNTNLSFYIENDIIKEIVYYVS